MIKEPKWPRLLPAHVVVNVATLGPLGWWKAPGTWGSVAGLMWVTIVCVPAGWFVSLLLTAAGLYLALAFCGEAERRLARIDPSEVILDEFACVPLVFLGLFDDLGTGEAWAVYLLGFGLFRLFDIVKPFGIGALQRFPGGVGVVLDDIAAGLVACGLLHVIVRLTPLLEWLRAMRSGGAAVGIEAG
jgi:phosphatidylglycerophosphatase A